MGTITDYKVVAEHDLEKLVKGVQQFIGEGWQPFGGLQVAVPVLDGAPAPIYCQAMVKS